MTLPTTTTLNSCDDSDMFGPPRSSPPIGYHHHRSRVPMISPKLRQREERKRILQLCAHKLERIKDSETNLRRSVCINNTYCRLTDELRREKQSRYLANLPKSDSKPESARENIFNPYNSCSIDSSNHQPSNKLHMQCDVSNNNNNNNNAGRCPLDSDDEDIDIMSHNNNSNKHNNHNILGDMEHSSIATTTTSSSTTTTQSSSAISTSHHQQQQHDSSNGNSCSTMSAQSNNTCHDSSAMSASSISSATAISTTTTSVPSANQSSSSTNTTTVHHYSTTSRKRHSKDLDTDLEILDRELNAINSPMPLIDPEITQGAEQLEKAISRKRARSEDDNDRLVREALQFYMPPPRVISAIEDGPLDLGGLMMMGGGPFASGMSMGMAGMGMSMSMGMGMSGMAAGMSMHGMSMGLGVSSCSSSSGKRQKLNGGCSVSASSSSASSLSCIGGGNDLVELDFDITNQSQKEFEVIMDALRLGTPSPTPSMGSDSCGQAAMMMSESANVFHNLVVTSLET